MGYNDVFGGGSINPAQRTYLELTISSDVVLQWPIEQQIGGDDVAVDIIDIEATQPGLNVDYSDARQVSTGYTTLFNNIGSETVTIRDAGGGTVISLDSGEAWFVYLTDNSTLDGVWRTFQLGVGISTASASGLAGAGLKAISMTLNQTIPPTIVLAGSSPLNMTDADRAQLNIWDSGVGTFNLPDPGTVGSDWFTYIRNDGSGVLTVSTPSGVIDDGGSLMLNPGVSGTFVTDGTDWFTIGLTSSLDTGFDFTEIDVSGSGDFVLSGVQLDRVAYRFIGTLTGDRNIIVPSTIQEYWVDNETTGAFSLFVNTAGQATPPEVGQGTRNILYCDGSDVVFAETSDVTFPLTIAQGGTGATTAAGARTNLGVPPITRLIDTGIGLNGGGDLSIDREHNLEYVNLPSDTPAAGDFLTFQDIDDSDDIKKASITDILGAVPVISAEQLVDSSMNVRVQAELLGIAQLRSDGNVDAEVRLLEFAHSDGTPRILIGQPTASVNLVIANLMTGGGVDLTSGPSSSISFSPAGTLRVDVGLAAQLDIFADGNTDTEQLLVQLKDSSGNVKGDWGWTNTEAIMHLTNQINGQNMELRGFDAGGVPRIFLQMNPDNDVAIFDDGVEVLRTRTPAQGGAQANNQNTGAGFERVLTTSDLGGGGGGGQSGCKAFKSVSSPALISDVGTVMVFDDEAYDTDNFHSTVSNTSRLTIPSGVTIVRLKAYILFSSYLSGGKRITFIKNGNFFISIDDSQTAGSSVRPQHVVSGGVGQAAGLLNDSGQITVAQNDYFEVVVESLNQSGVNIVSSSWFELEVVA